MSTSKSKLEINNLPDTQGQADTRNMPINKVGIKDIVHPMIIKQRSGKEQSTIANFNMYVNYLMISRVLICQDSFIS